MKIAKVEACMDASSPLPRSEQNSAPLLADQSDHENAGAPLQRRKRKKSPGVRVKCGRLYDSKNGKTCHQCRQKTMDFMSTCKKKITGNKQCTLLFCCKCLLNRYGEKGEEMALLNDWICPKCRGICNCSYCMKKRGHKPTGILIYKAKANGFSSVLEMLNLKDFQNLDSEKMVRDDAGASSKKLQASDKEPAVAPAENCVKQNSFEGQRDLQLQDKPLKKNGQEVETRNSKLKNLRNKNGDGLASRASEDIDSITQKCNRKKHQIPKKAYKRREKVCKREDDRLLKRYIMVPKENHQESIKMNDIETEAPNKRQHDEILIGQNSAAESHLSNEKFAVEVKSKASEDELPLPPAILLKHIASIDIPVEDVGHALQFLEFCETFGEILNLKKGQSEELLQDLASEQSKHLLHHSSIIQLHFQLLSVIQKDLGKEYPYLKEKLDGDSLLQAVIKYISESQYSSKELQLDSFDVNGTGYDQLDSSKKLRLINFICDEALCTTDFRSFIDAQSLNFVEKEKEMKEKLLAEEKEARNGKKTLQDEPAGAIVMQKGSSLSISEHEDHVSKIKLGAAQTFGDPLEAMDTVFEEGWQSNVIRSWPVFLDGHGHKFWRLSCSSNEMDILRQDLEDGDFFISKERWYAYGIGQRPIVEQYISSFRNLRK